MLPAAWRKMWVSSATGDRARGRRGRRTACRRRPGASWSASPTSTTCVRPPTARSSVTSSSRLAIEVSSTISRPGVDLVDRRALAGDPAERGVDRGRVGARRLGHPARGAAGRRDERDLAFCALAAATSSRIVAVLPVPGPPVTIGQPVRERRGDRGGLLGRGLERRRVAHRAGGLQHRLRARRARSIRVRELRLERRGRAGGTPTPPSSTSTHELAVVGHRAEQRGVRRRAVEQRRRPRRRARRPGGRSSRRARPRRARGRRRRARARGRPARSRRRGRSRRRSGSRRRTRWSARTGRSRTTRCARSPCSLVIRGTSQASPCGASSRCSARLDRSPCHERTASFVRLGFSPAARNARVRVGVDRLQHVRAVALEQLAPRGRRRRA